MLIGFLILDPSFLLPLLPTLASLAPSRLDLIVTGLGAEDLLLPPVMDLVDHISLIVERLLLATAADHLAHHRRGAAQDTVVMVMMQCIDADAVSMPVTMSMPVDMSMMAMSVESGCRGSCRVYCRIVELANLAGEEAGRLARLSSGSASGSSCSSYSSSSCHSDARPPLLRQLTKLSGMREGRHRVLLPLLTTDVEPLLVAQRRPLLGITGGGGKKLPARRTARGVRSVQGIAPLPHRHHMPGSCRRGGSPLSHRRPCHCHRSGGATNSYPCQWLRMRHRCTAAGLLLLVLRGAEGRREGVAGGRTGAGNGSTDRTDGRLLRRPQRRLVLLDIRTHHWLLVGGPQPGYQ